MERSVFSTLETLIDDIDIPSALTLKFMGATNELRNSLFGVNGVLWEIIKKNIKNKIFRKCWKMAPRPLLGSLFSPWHHTTVELFPFKPF